MRLNRREFLGATGICALSACGPKLAIATMADGFFHLEAGLGKADLYGDKGEASELWLYNDTLPGPAIRAKKGEHVRVRFTNRLDEPTSVHWHGIRIINAMDGVSGLTQDPVMPGESFDYKFIAPDAGTYWYHAHHMSWNQVPRGLAGSLIIEEEDNLFAAENDITMMLNDWRLDENGRLDAGSFGAPHDLSHAGRLGNWLTVNGQNFPNIPLQAGQWHRIRLINSSTARILDIAPGRFGARIIGFDGQTFDAPRSVDGVVQLAPAQRMDLVMKPEKPGTIPFETMTGEPYTFANFVVEEGAEGPDLQMPASNQLPEPDIGNAKIIPMIMQGGAMGRLESLIHKGRTLSGRQLVEQRQFWGLNGVAGMGKNPLFAAQTGETIVFESRNDTAFPHAIHIHGHHFKVLEKNGVALPHQDWRDTFISNRGESVKIAFVADNPGKWLIHCHMLGHAVSGMMNWFVVD